MLNEQNSCSSSVAHPDIPLHCDDEGRRTISLALPLNI